MLGTESVFNVLASDDTERRVASRRALALAHTRVENHLGEFLRQAVDTEEFSARLAACQEEFIGYIRLAAEEVGYDKPEYIAQSLSDHYAREAAGMVKEAPGHKHRPEWDAKRNRQYEHVLEETGDEEEAARVVNKTRRKKHELKDSGFAGTMPLPGGMPDPALQSDVASGGAAPAPSALGNEPPHPTSNPLFPTPAPSPNPALQSDVASGGALPGALPGAMPGGAMPNVPPNAPPSAPPSANPAIHDQLKDQMPVRPGISGVFGKRSWTPFLADRTAGFGGGSYQDAYEPEWGATEDSAFAAGANDHSCRRCGRPYSEHGSMGECPGDSYGEMYPGYGAGGEDPDSAYRGHEWRQEYGAATPEGAGGTETRVSCPLCGGSGDDESPLPRKDGKPLGDTPARCKQCGGSGKVPHFGPSILDQLEASVKTADGGNTDLGGPSPKMDKRKWTPQTVGNPDPGSTNHPNKRKDILQTGKPRNDEELTEIGEQTTERQDLPTADGDSGWNTTEKPPRNNERVNVDGTADPVGSGTGLLT